MPFSNTFKRVKNYVVKIKKGKPRFERQQSMDDLIMDQESDKDSFESDRDNQSEQRLSAK